MNCKTCKNFTPLKKVMSGTNLAGDSPGFGYCDSSLFADREDYWHDDGFKDAKFLYFDNEGYGAYFYVHEDFGCVGWKECQS